MANPMMNNMASGKSPALASLINSKMFGKKKTMPKVKKKPTMPVTPTAPSTTPMAPKGIAVGNPNAMKA